MKIFSINVLFTLIIISLANDAVCQQSPYLYYKGQGEEQLNKKQFEEAVKSFTDCIKENKKADACYTGRGQANLALSNLKQAQSDFEMAIKINPENTAATEELAKIKSGGKVPVVVKKKEPETTKDGNANNNSSEPVIIIKTPAFDRVYAGKSNLFYITKDKKQGLMNTEGKIITEPYYDDITPNRKEDMFSVKLNGKYGYINAKGQVIVSPQYDEGYSFEDGLALVCMKDNNKRRNIGYINTKGVVVIPLKYNAGGFFKEGLSAMKKASTGLIEDLYIYLDVNGNQAIKTAFGSAQNFNEGFAVVSNSDYEYGVINKKGELVVPFKYYYIAEFKDGFARVELEKKMGFIDKTGKEIVPIIYDDAISFSDGVASVKKNGKRGFVDATGKLIIPTVFDYDYGFHSGTALVSKADKWGLIDKTGKEIIPIMYDVVYNLTPDHSLFKVKENNKIYLVDKNNRKITKTGFDDIGLFAGEYAIVEENKKKGLINKKGEIVVPLKYDVITEVMEGVAYVSNASGSGLIKVSK